MRLSVLWRTISKKELIELDSLASLIPGLQEVEFEGVPAGEIRITEVHTVGSGGYTGIIIRTIPEVQIPVSFRHYCLSPILGVDRVDINLPESPREDFSGYAWHVEGFLPTTT